MVVSVHSEDGTLLWKRGEGHGMTSTSYIEDGTLVAIIGKLTESLIQARGELGVTDDVELDVYMSPAPAEV